MKLLHEVESLTKL